MAGLKQQQKQSKTKTKQQKQQTNKQKTVTHAISYPLEHIGQCTIAYTGLPPERSARKPTTTATIN